MNNTFSEYTTLGLHILLLPPKTDVCVSEMKVLKNSSGLNARSKLHFCSIFDLVYYSLCHDKMMTSCKAVSLFLFVHTRIELNCLEEDVGHRSYTIFSYENRRLRYKRESNVNFDLGIFRHVTVCNVCWATDDYVCQCKFVL